MLLVQVKIALAGKVAEALLLGVAGMDHGGGEGSNLANATITVVRLLTNGGFGARLTWTGAVTPATVGMLLRSDPVLAAEVERTLRVQFVSTHRLLARCHGALETVAGLLEQHGVVNGAIVERILATPIEGGIQ
ncbi:hypothetical protein FBZ92_101129 [Nitrospirillum viridazoti]|uniref:Uncharacterized protein n=2 Tax=Nitrospirillum TaxID=1543705 RepID=A0A560IZA1_9PROT|nr:hypothetical protein FBZ92_101129 [Nitrospirillum amazonense]